ncbi:M28 family metallopeptidase [Paraconexibacter sp.]|uniref:M28 family metallopeptidase n=1 Tax=Paraconexibacter sp. TaxID=2949640 RepID=UPI0035624791
MSRRLAVVVSVPVAVLLVALAVLIPDGEGDDRGAVQTRAQTSASDATVSASRQTAGDPDPAVPASKLRRFDADRAMRLLRWQVSYGQRPAGSAALRRLAPQLAKRLPAGRLVAVPGHPGLQNVVGTLPGRRPAIVVGAHYDSEAHPPGFVGANDGAAGTAAVIEIARAMRKTRRPAGARELRFVLFDGEEEPPNTPDAEFYERGLRGSKAYAAAHARSTRALILLDYVAGIGQRIPREGSSDVGLWRRLRSAARRAGVLRVFPDRSGAAIYDDHTPFLERGIPAIDLIDFTYAYRDTVQDTPDKTSVKAIDAVGETVVELLRALDRSRY